MSGASLLRIQRRIMASENMASEHVPMYQAQALTSLELRRPRDLLGFELGHWHMPRAGQASALHEKRMTAASADAAST